MCVEHEDHDDGLLLQVVRRQESAAGWLSECESVYRDPNVCAHMIGYGRGGVLSEQCVRRRTNSLARPKFDESP